MEKKIFKAKQSDKILNILTGIGFSYANANKLLRNKDVRIEDIKIKDNVLVDAGDEITVFYDKDMLKEQTFDIVYQDDNIIIANKPTGIEVEGKDGLADKLHALAVHRLDRNTTGLTILAKNMQTKNNLMEAFKAHTITKKYLAEVVGKTEFKNYKMTAYLLKDAKTSFVKIFDKQVKGSSEIISIFNTIKSTPTSSIVECQLITGKTHQIRASLSFLGHPIIGDGKYGKNEDNKKFKQKTQVLHCYYLKFEKLQDNLSYLNNREFTKMPVWWNKQN